MAFLLMLARHIKTLSHNVNLGFVYRPDGQYSKLLQEDSYLAQRLQTSQA